MFRNLDQGASDWHKSSYSEEHADCVETGTPLDAHSTAVAVRDTKHHRAGPVLAFTTPAWSAFIGSLRQRP